MKKLLVLFLLLTISACSVFESTETARYQKSTAIQNKLAANLPTSWKTINSESSDYAIANSKTNSIFIINSACKKFEANDLNALTSSMLSGVTIVKTIDKKIITFQGRDAVDMTVVGKLDGVERFFHLLTTQKNNCIYDFVLISTNEKNLNTDNQDYTDFINRIELN